jgi:MoaA/NifB/PqqE/SkfB family radical SAM enzyme
MIHLSSALENIYISPLEVCNLKCHLCYTRKTRNILTNAQIVDFINKYSNFIHKSYFLNLKSILFCGGEVFLLPDFPTLVNQLLSQGIFVSLITNGTLDRLDQIKDPSNCQILVSLDGPQEVHDHNRGPGHFDQSLKFIQHALQLGFPTEIMFLVTAQSYPFIDSFPKTLNKLVRADCLAPLPNRSPLRLNYITYKSPFYTDSHPLSQNTPATAALNPAQIINLKKNYPSIPDKKFGCFQLSLQSNGQIYGCCESPYSLGKIDDHPRVYINNFFQALDPCTHCLLNNLTLTSSTTLASHSSSDALNADSNYKFFARNHPKRSDGREHEKFHMLSRESLCHGCCAPDFLCGYKKELHLTTCQEVVKTLK